MQKCMQSSEIKHCFLSTKRLMHKNMYLLQGFLPLFVLTVYSFDLLMSLYEKCLFPLYVHFISERYSAS